MCANIHVFKMMFRETLLHIETYLFVFLVDESSVLNHSSQNCLTLMYISNEAAYYQTLLIKSFIKSQKPRQCSIRYCIRRNYIRIQINVLSRGLITWYNRFIIYRGSNDSGLSITAKYSRFAGGAKV